MRVARFLFAAAAALAGAALAVGVSLGGTTSDGDGVMVLNGKKVFPLVLAKGPDAGTTAPDGTSAFAAVARAGINFMKLGPATTPWTTSDIADANSQDRAAAGAGLSTWVNLSTVAKAAAGSSSDALLQQVVGSLTADAGAPAIGAWKGLDEPFWSGVAPSALQFAYCRSTGRGQSSWCAGEPVLDSAHQWVSIEAPRGTASQLEPYSAVTDIHGVDVYPVTLASPTPNLHDVGTWTSTIASITPGHAVWTTLQVCASGSYDTSGHYVLPTFAQERYMAYDSIVNGARSLAFYGGNIAGCWNATDRQYGWNWTFWTNVLAPLVGELSASSALAPALVDPGSTKVLTTDDPSTEAISRSGAGGDLWVIAARSGAGTQQVTISGLPQGLAAGDVYTEGRRAAPTPAGALTDSFDQWGVHVYHFAAPPPVTTATTSPTTTTTLTTTTTPTTTTTTTPTTTSTLTTTTTPTTTTAPPPAPPPASGGGGGGGGGSTPNLGVSLTPSSTSVALGQAVDVSIVVQNRGDAGSLQTHLAIVLAPGLKLVAAPYFERGSGCTGDQTIDCFLDYVPNQSSTRVAFEVQTTAAGPAPISATATSDRDADPSDNSAAVTIDVQAPASPPPTAVTPPRHTAARTFSGTTRADRITGTAGNDLIYGRAGNDRLSGGRGNDVLYGGAGNDVLVGGPGLDRLFGGPGNDTIEAVDGSRDVVDCGPGRDVARVDRVDRVSGCEHVLRR